MLTLVVSFFLFCLSSFSLAWPIAVAGVRADTQLLGASYYESGLVDQWVHWAASEVDAPCGALVYVLRPRVFDLPENGVVSVDVRFLMRLLFYPTC